MSNDPQKPRAKREYPSTIRHPALFEIWYAAGRKVTPELLAAGKYRDRETIYEMRDRENWPLFAEVLDEEQAFQIADWHTEKTARRLETERQRLALIQGGQELLKETLLRMLQRAQKGADIDTKEVDEWFKGLANSDKVIVSAFNIAAEQNVKHSGTVEHTGLSPESQQRVEEARRKMREQEAQA